MIDNIMIKWMYNGVANIGLILRLHNHVIVIKDNDEVVYVSLPIGIDLDLKRIFSKLKITAHSDVMRPLILSHIEKYKTIPSDKEVYELFNNTLMSGVIERTNIIFDKKPSGISTEQYKKIQGEVVKKIDKSNIINKKEIMNMIDYIKENCKPIIKEIDNSGILLYRGNKSQVKTWGIKEARLHNRIPNDIPDNIHRMMNDMFYYKFRWKARNGVFASTDARNCTPYGNVYIFFPIGEYEYVWSPRVNDLYETISDILENADDGEEIHNELESIVDTYISGWVIKSNGNEVSFNCDSYVLINPLYTEVIKVLLSNAPLSKIYSVIGN